MADEEWRSSFLVNDTDTEIKVWYYGFSDTLKPKSVGNILWRTSHRRGTYVPRFELDGVELDQEISINDLYDYRGIIIFGAADNSYYSFQPFQWAQSKSMDQVSFLPQWTSLRRTKFVNKTDREIQIQYERDMFTLEPNHSVFTEWVDDSITMNSIPKLRLDGVDLIQNRISLEDLYRIYENEEITIFRGVYGTYCLGTFSEYDDLREKVDETMHSAKKLLETMEELLKKVMICDKQCKHLFDKCQKGVGMMVRVLGSHELDKIFSAEVHLVKFMCSKMMCCILEGHELLQSCGKNDYNKAAFALSSPQSLSASTLSRFSLVLRELDWIEDFISFVENHIIFKRGSINDWKWCEESCRLKYYPELRDTGIVVEEESLEADAQRQTADREAFWASLKSMLLSDSSLSKNPSVFSTLKHGGISSFRSFSKRLGMGAHHKELQGVWRKRLLATSRCSRPNSLPRGWSWINKTDFSEPSLAPAGDWFQIDKPDFKVVEHLASGAFKHVNVCKWLGETVAVAVLVVPKEHADAEASLLARVQHPNVVELRGYVYKENTRKPQGLLVTELMDQDLGSLINHQRRATGSEGPPFALPVAIDISLQIVEAMIHLKECGVLHRDLKPKNCLASPKCRKDLIPSRCSDVPNYYTIKLIDFGAAKIRDEDSYFHTYKQGTPYYMAPEVYGKSEQECPYTWSADVYSFGMTCFEVFTGKAPFKLKTKFKEVQKFICGGGRPSFLFELPSLIKKLIERCWAENPTERPSFKDIRKDLWQCKLNAATSAESDVIADFNIQFSSLQNGGTHDGTQQPNSSLQEVQRVYSRPTDCTDHVPLHYSGPTCSCSSNASSSSSRMGKERWIVGEGLIGERDGRERVVDGEADEGHKWTKEVDEVIDEENKAAENDVNREDYDSRRFKAADMEVDKEGDKEVNQEAYKEVDEVDGGRGLNRDADEELNDEADGGKGADKDLDKKVCEKRDEADDGRDDTEVDEEGDKGSGDEEGNGGSGDEEGNKGSGDDGGRGDKEVDEEGNMGRGDEEVSREGDRERAADEEVGGRRGVEEYLGNTRGMDGGRGADRHLSLVLDHECSFCFCCQADPINKFTAPISHVTHQLNSQ